MSSHVLDLDFGQGLRLHVLPSDIMRKIIHVGPENVNNFSLISRRWNALVNELLLPIKWIGWFEGPYYGKRVISMDMHIPAQFRAHFSVDQCYYHSTKEIKSIGCVEVNTERFITTETLPGFSRLFARCAIIERVELLMDISKCKDEVKLIGNAMKDVDIGTIAITKPFPLLDVAKSAILYFLEVRRNPIKRLMIAEQTIRETIRSHGSLLTSPIGQESFVSQALKFAREVQIQLSDDYNSASYWRMMVADLNASGEVIAQFDVENSEDGKKCRSVRLTANNDRK